MQRHYLMWPSLVGKISNTLQMISTISGLNSEYQPWTPTDYQVSKNSQPIQSEQTAILTSSIAVKMRTPLTLNYQVWISTRRSTSNSLKACLSLYFTLVSTLSHPPLTRHTILSLSYTRSRNQVRLYVTTRSIFFGLYLQTYSIWIPCSWLVTRLQGLSSNNLY